MACEFVIGDDCSINRGETIELFLLFRSEDETPIDLTGGTLQITEAKPSSIITDAEVTITDAPQGRARFVLPREHVDKLGIGRVNFFRVAAFLGPESDIVSPKIWIQVT
jgi:hypothetical protein